MHIGGCSLRGELLREDTLEDQRAAYAASADRVRACLTFGLLPSDEKQRLEEIAFIYPPDKLGVKGRPAAPRLPIYTPTYHELCEIAGWPQVTEEGLLALFKFFPKQKISLCHIDIDPYPGDGYETERAFFTFGAVRRCVKWLGRKYLPFKIRIVRSALVPDRRGKVRLDDIEGPLLSDRWLQLLNGRNQSWLHTVQWFFAPDATEPDFEAQAANDAERDKEFDEYEPDLIEKAIAIAVTAHRGQVDKTDRPYILHPLRLMCRMETDTERIVAVLHDVIEDTPVTADDLRREGFPEEVLDALDRLTKRDGETYDDFIKRASADPTARRVKLADLEDNMDVRRLATVGERDAARLTKYLRAWRELKALPDS